MPNGQNFMMLYDIILNFSFAVALFYSSQSVTDGIVGVSKSFFQESTDFSVFPGPKQPCQAAFDRQNSSRRVIVIEKRLTTPGAVVASRIPAHSAQLASPPRLTFTCGKPKVRGVRSAVQGTQCMLGGARWAVYGARCELGAARTEGHGAR